MSGIDPTWVRAMVCDWIQKIDDPETLRDWCDAAGDRLRRADTAMTVSERLAHEVTHSSPGPHAWHLIGVERARQRMEPSTNPFSYDVSVHRVTLVYERREEQVPA